MNTGNIYNQVKKLKREAKAGDRYAVTIGIGIEDRKSVTAVIRQKYEHVVYMEYRKSNGAWRPLSMSWVKLFMESKGKKL